MWGHSPRPIDTVGAASGAGGLVGTVCFVSRLNPRHLDHARTLTPRDYASDPTLFGVVLDLGFLVPEGGTTVSMRIAMVQHRSVCIWAAQRKPSAAFLCRRFGFSKQTFSRVTRGERWAGETVLAALSEARTSAR